MATIAANAIEQHDELAAAGSTPPQCCGVDQEPFVNLQAFVVTVDGVTFTGGDNDGVNEESIAYESAGDTDVLWETERGLGYGCPRCGTVTFTTNQIQIAGRMWVLADTTDA